MDYSSKTKFIEQINQCDDKKTVPIKYVKDAIIAIVDYYEWVLESQKQYHKSEIELLEELFKLPDYPLKS